MRTHEPDAYRLLGVPVDAEPQQIRERYLALSRQYHPDRAGGSARATAAFQAIAGAYKTLGDRNQREAVDRAIALQDPWRLANDPRAERAVDAVNGLLDRVARRRPQLPHARRGRDLRVVVQVPFAAAIRGGVRAVDANWRGTCDGCGGTGSDDLTQEPSCHVCDGSGVVRAGLRREAHRCGFCAGRGVVLLRPCSRCDGEGTRDLQRTIDVELPARCRDGALLRVRDGGEPGTHGGAAGDLIVDVRVLPDPWLRLEGDDIVGRLPVTIRQACLGGSIDVPCLEGVERLRLPAGVEEGQELRVVGRGAPRLGGGRGDLRYRIEIDVPRLDVDNARDATAALDALEAAVARSAHRKVHAFANDLESRSRS